MSALSIGRHSNHSKTTSIAHLAQKKYGYKRMLIIAALLMIISTITLSIFCPESLCSSQIQSFKSRKQWISTYPLMAHSLHSDISKRFEIDRILLHQFGYDYEDFVRFKLSKIRMASFDYIFKSQDVFQMNATDVLVFLHMQKTGGSAFDRHLVRDLILEQPCKCDSRRKKKCRCFRPGTSNKYWLFSRYSIGWKCGLHADYTELTNCVDRILDQVERSDLKSKVMEKRNFYFLTLMRDPIARFLSEFKHVQRGATWKTSRHWCDGRLATSKEIPFCFHGPNWRNVSFDEFISCPNNLAFNRQTRMLADLSLVGCYNRSIMSESERDSVILFSAKQNLRQMAFFGLCEEQLATQYMFEKVFRLKFKRPFIQFNKTRSHEVYSSLSQSQIEKIRQLNHLDVALYSYAKQLFKSRFALIKEQDPDFEDYYQKLVLSSQLLFQKNKLAKMNKKKPSVLSSHLPTTIQISTTKSKDNLIEDFDDETSPIADSIDENDSVEDYYV